MKSKPISFAGTLLLILVCTYSFAQSFGIKSSAVWLSDCNQSNYFNTSGSGADLIGPVANAFQNANLGSHTQNSSTLILRGGQVRTFKNPASSNVCNARMYYRVYLQTGTPGAFTMIDLGTAEDCGAGSYTSGGTCSPGDQKWNRVIADGTTVPYAPINLTSFAPGNYVLEVYYDATGSQTTTSGCSDIVTDNNSSNNYKATFSINAPTISSTNPSSCSGSQGSITIGGLTPGATYQLSYNDDGTDMGPDPYTANASGQITITGLNKGFYSNFTFVINGCTTSLFTGITLSDPIYIPTFTAIAPFCAGTAAPSLPATSNNGFAGTWNPATISNTSSGTYTFTPSAGQCAIPISINVTVVPRTTPTFSFGTSLTICSGGSVPALPTTSQNGITGTWSPATVSNTNSGTYTFTPTAGLCANPTTFTVTVTPNITPTFSFGTNTTICSGGTVVTLPTTSQNGVTGTWSPATISNTSSATYTFTPTAGQCALPTTYDVTVNPNITPTFSFGTSLNICSGGAVPTLPTTSQNGVNGTWSPATVSSTITGTYTFTPTAGQCAVPNTFVVTVNPNITPTFSFGTSLTICSGGTVPTLVTTSQNGITGTWSPSTVSNTSSASYTFTPAAGQCALPTTFAVTVNPNITPTFSFGTNTTICSGGAVVTLPTTSQNGITGTWSPATISNTSSATYTFTPTAGQCALPTTYNVTVNPNITPTFSFGTSLTICSGGTVPTLPTTSQNGVNGTWSPATVSTTISGTYTFTPTGGQCALPNTFVVTVNPNITPTFSFGTSLTICSGGTVPTLPTTSQNGITGTWSSATVSNTNSATYTFTPTAGQCALPASFSVTVNPNITPTFSFGTSLTICSGGTVPTLPTTSQNGITGTWSPAIVSNTNSATYTFTPAAGQCVTGGTTFTVTVTANIAPTFSFGSSLTICNGGTVPTLPTTSQNGITGTWNPATVTNTNSATYTFTPTAGQCATPFTYTVTVNPIVTPTFSFGTTQSVCIGAVAPALPTTSQNGITGTWSPATIDNQNSATYTFTPNPGQCTVGTTLTYQVNPVPSVNVRTDTTVYDGAIVPGFNFTNTPGSTVTWTNSNPAIGLAATGTGAIPSFTAINLTNAAVTATITLTPRINGCAGTVRTYVITVLPLNKDVFVPNVFSPNGDGKNDLLFVYGNYINKVDMRIFNQWGQQVASITSKTQSWDGRHKGNPQPVGVYMYVCQATLTDGRTVTLKGSITLVR